ncbi:hypothetical protein QBC34DRAFT_381316 [Podospora aff. communis PSN243]|uniref:G domain-containing protein n=1 Tax=Podospora aff. communis PSN243 TaxID=3040156 RepID=A0AAV9GJ87_9PEZI|nr:hypothetical protein QBC34DRAFT_381316 [Podospora aff. communis PSN243]
MPDALVERPALGQKAELGALYDARSDTFIHTSVFKHGPPPAAVKAKYIGTTSLQLQAGSTLKERFRHFGVGPELGVGIIAGLVPVSGCGNYLNPSQTTGQAAGLGEALSLTSVDASVATHVVTGITWGAQCVVTATHSGAVDDHKPSSSAASGPDVLAAYFPDLKLKLAQPTGDMDEGTLQHQQANSTTLKLSFFSDIWPEFGDTPDNLDDVQKFISKIPGSIDERFNGRGCPIAYTLLPLSFLSMIGLINVEGNATVCQPAITCLQDFIGLIDNLHLSYDRLESYIATCRWCPSVVPQHHIANVSDQVRQARSEEALLRKKVAKALQLARAGRVETQALPNILEEFISSKALPGHLESLLSYAGRIHFAMSITQEKVVYVGYGEPTLTALVAQNLDKNLFVLYFNESLRSKDNHWSETFALVTDILRGHSRDQLVIAVDCDALGHDLERACIFQYRNGRVVCDDFLEFRKLLGTNCVMRRPDEAVDRTATGNGKPLDRRQVKIPCPHISCDSTLHCTWICATCVSVVEYSFNDGKLYCDCGTTCHEHWQFRCKGKAHGTGWARYDDENLLRLLESLEPWKELNILILGETGVGKSTWINAFANYLTHDSLESALESDLQWLVPCSFKTQTRDTSCNEGKFVQRNVKIGSSREEKDGAKGQSATQKTSVYTVDIWNTRVRLIDTPGIGDTRGLDQDNKKRADILRVLHTYKSLHGIIILLKPNAARLTVMFRFCIKQLLTHLHKNAAKNIVFGFTNTSNYQPGDTFKPLETLLKEYEKIQMGLFKRNVYCFDSESFRYLAAHKMGIDIGLLEDNSRSWEYSVQECRRLVDYFRILTPHNVRSTINLNETREMIVSLQEPMAIIAQKIQTSITVNNQQIGELRNTELSRAELEKRLYVQRESVESYEVGEPRTICAHPDCIEIRNDPGGGEETIVIYKTMCHKPCGLVNCVKRNERGNEALQNCVAIDSNTGFCRACKHHYKNHMHIYYDYRPTTHQHQDATISESLTTAIEEFQLEHSQVQEAAIQFGFFLKRHAIEPYNDGTVEYVDHLIEVERLKINNGGRKETLDMLEKYKAGHCQKVAALTKAMERGENTQVLDDKGVQQLIVGLYGLPHFGKDLERMVKVNAKAADAVFREKTCNLTAGRTLGREADGTQV